MIVTRADPGASETVARLALAGYTPIKSPALKLRETEPAPDLDTTGLQGLIFTSANGVRFFAARCADRAPTAWCVGPATAAAARDAGFDRIVDADGASDALADRITTDADPAAGPLLHVANIAAAGDLAATLRRRGFLVDFAPLYETADADGLSDEAVETLKGGADCAVLIHSAKGAAAFSRLAGRHLHAAVSIIAVSDKASAPLGGHHGPVMIAPKPNEDLLFRTLKQAFPPV